MAGLPAGENEKYPAKQGFSDGEDIGWGAAGNVRGMKAEEILIYMIVRRKDAKCAKKNGE